MRYKFRYYNGTFKLLKLIYVPLMNFVFPFVVMFILARIVALMGLGQYLNNEETLNIIQKLTLTSSFLFTIIYCVLRKGVFVYERYLVIARYTITTRNWNSKITLKYDDIESVNINYNDLRFTKYHGSLLVPFGDNTYNIEITMKNGRKYFFSIENQEEFCDHLNSLI